MPILPASAQELVNFCAAHAKTWADAPASIGLTAAQVTAMNAKTGTAQTALADQQSAHDSAKAATVTARSDVSALRKSVADLLKIIKAYAETQANPDAVYAAAEIPPPATPGPTPPPGTPTDLTVTLLATGALALAWKCPNPEGTQGTLYEVKRKLGSGAGDFGYVGSSGVRKFEDETVPTVSTVAYQITAVRSTQRGRSAQFIVNFGTGGGGAGVTVMNVTGSEDAAVRMAA